MCGIVGAFGVPECGRKLSLMLKSLQHRGQEAAGFATRDDGKLYVHKDLGLVDEVVKHLDFDLRLPGSVGIGHVRYPTTGDPTNRENIQPLQAHLTCGEVAVVCNGNLTNYRELRERLEASGSIFRSTSDTEVFLHLLQRAGGNGIVSRLKSVLTQVEGAYSLLILTPEGLLVARDPYGFRPLLMARHENGFMFSSESCAFDLFKATDRVTLKAGTITEVNAVGVATHTFQTSDYRRYCAFEDIYFTRPDSFLGDETVDRRRWRLGEALGHKNAIEADVVVGVPDSSNTMALAFAEKSGIPFRFGLIRNHYTGRTFITPSQVARELGVRMKLNPVSDIIEGRRVIVVDDSLVRGTTMRKVAELLREAGAVEVHARLASPRIIHPCFWGIDTPRRRELLAPGKTDEEIAAACHLDSVDFLTVEELRAALGDTDATRYCTTCFTGAKPVPEHEMPTV